MTDQHVNGAGPAAGLDYWAEPAYLAPATADDDADYLRALETADPPPDSDRGAPTGPPLRFSTFAELADRVDQAGPRRWLIRGIWPAADYGVIGAEHKAQKTWTAIELAVAVAAGVPWLGAFAVDTSGPVILFAGEGGEGNIVRRVRAVCRTYGADPRSLRLHICTRAPHLNNAHHLALVAERIDAVRPALVIIDPFYLAAKGGRAAELFDMGALLEQPQHICQDHGAALVVVHHLNRKGQGPATSRLSGAGPAEWGRVLIGGEVKSRHTDRDTRATTVTTRLDVVGGEVPDQTIEVTRTIWADDPDDLDAPLHLKVEAERVDDDRGRRAGVDPDQLRVGEPDPDSAAGDWADPLRWPIPQDIRDLAVGGRGGKAVPHLAQYMRAHSSNPAGVGVSRAEAVRALRAQLRRADGTSLYRDETVIRRAWDRLLETGRLQARTKTPHGPALWVARDDDPGLA